MTSILWKYLPIEGILILASLWGYARAESHLMSSYNNPFRTQYKSSLDESFLKRFIDLPLQRATPASQAGRRNAVAKALAAFRISALNGTVRCCV